MFCWRLADPDDTAMQLTRPQMWNDSSSVKTMKLKKSRYKISAHTPVEKMRPELFIACPHALPRILCWVVWGTCDSALIRAMDWFGLHTKACRTHFLSSIASPPRRLFFYFFPPHCQMSVLKHADFRARQANKVCFSSPLTPSRLGRPVRPLY